MKTKIANNLKNLRVEKGITKEELATHLGISSQAICHWEIGDEMPDINLLPKIAEFYNTTVNELFGIGNSTMEKEILEFEKRVNSLKSSSKEYLNLCRDMQKKYPNNETVLNYLMYGLYSLDCINNHKEIITIAKKIFRNGESKYRENAIQILTYTYNALGDPELAAEFGKKSYRYPDPIVQILKGNDLIEYCQEYLFNAIDDIIEKSNYVFYRENSPYSPFERHNFAKHIYNLYHIIFSGSNLASKENKLAWLCYCMACNSAEMGESTRAISELNKMLTHIIKFENFICMHQNDITIPQICPQKILLEEYTDLKKRYFDLIKKNSQFNLLHDDPQFIELINIIK